MINQFAVKGKGSPFLFFHLACIDQTLLGRRTFINLGVTKYGLASQIPTTMCQWESRSGREPRTLQEHYLIGRHVRTALGEQEKDNFFKKSRLSISVFEQQLEESVQNI